MKRRLIVAGMLAATVSTAAANEPNSEGSEDEPRDVLSAETFAGLKFRCLGPALTSGRVGDLAVDPDNPARYYVGVASGGVWKTTNGGTTFAPVFDKQASFSIGCVTLDPENPNVVWVGTGENNSQRSVAFGDGVYRSRDGGANWENLGLPESEHIGMIAIDPRDTQVVYVAAQGPLWRSGGDRGLYKTTDGGATWDQVLQISEDTGVNEVHLDPRDPDTVYASAYQRRRHVWTLINGGPESAIYKSTDAGRTWRQLTKGLPDVDLGRIGLDLSPADPDVVYAIVEAADEKGGFYRSINRGETWERRSDYRTTSPQYYNEIVCDPTDVDRVYALDTFLHVTENGGKTFQRVPRDFRHVDDHALWINPQDPKHLLIGCDGGLYESYDRAANWRFLPNLPVTQFYRVSVDNSAPFYYVYGGTQDNSTLGAPSRTRDRVGIASEHWFVTVGGDGYETQVDPEDPNIVYSLWQYGGLVRHDRRSGEVTDIKPREAPGEPPLRWNWDSPLLISPHHHRRLFFAANVLYRSDDGGDSWTAISGDLSRQIDRDQLQVFDKLQSADAVGKNTHTSAYGNIVSLTESPLVEGLIYAGTDDGLVQMTEDGGQSWRRIERFPGVPEMTYVSCLTASRHDPDTVFAAFDNHKQGDFKPYLLRSQDRGRTWTSITGDLPERDICYSLQQDHMVPELLFVGTEFGAYFSFDGGQQWIRLTGDLPTIAVRDLDIQRRENDLVLGTFGRGIYVLDDYSPLRHVSRETLERGPVLFPVRFAWRYVETSRLGGRSGRGSQGASFWSAPNPPFGAIFTYHLPEKTRTRKELRQKAEKEAEQAGRTAPYPSFEELAAEAEEVEPSVILTVRDSAGNVIRRLNGPRQRGIRRVAWNLRYPAATPIRVEKKKDRPPWERPPSGPLALPGEYSVELAQRIDGRMSPLADPQPFEVVPLELATFAAEDRQAVLEFRQRAGRLQRAVRGAIKTADEARTRVEYLRKAILETPAADASLAAELHGIEDRLKKLQVSLRGDPTRFKREDPQPPSIRERVEQVVSSQWRVTSPPTGTQREALAQAGQQFAPVLAELRGLIQEDLANLEHRLETLGAPWTPGRVPIWTPE